jgi:hypothetical protein
MPTASSPLQRFSRWSFGWHKALFQCIGGSSRLALYGCRDTNQVPGYGDRGSAVMFRVLLAIFTCSVSAEYCWITCAERYVRCSEYTTRPMFASCRT